MAMSRSSSKLTFAIFVLFSLKEVLLRVWFVFFGSVELFWLLEFGKFFKSGLSNRALFATILRVEAVGILLVRCRFAKFLFSRFSLFSSIKFFFDLLIRSGVWRESRSGKTVHRCTRLRVPATHTTHTLWWLQVISHSLSSIYWQQFVAAINHRRPIAALFAAFKSLAPKSIPQQLTNLLVVIWTHTLKRRSNDTHSAHRHILRSHKQLKTLNF